MFLRIPPGTDPVNYQIFLEQYIKSVKCWIAELSKAIHDDLQHKAYDEEKIRNWLQLNDVLHMYQACLGFQRGSFFYRSDAAHPASEKHQSCQYAAVTTSPNLEPITYRNDLNKLIMMSNCYQITDEKNIALVLKGLFFNRTSFDCGASIQIANYVTLLKFLKLMHGDNAGEEYFNQLFAAKSNDAHTFNRFRIGLMGSHYLGQWYHFSSIYFFTEINKGFRVEELIDYPDKYVGMRFGVGGHPHYHKKHERGAGGAWNVIFVGLCGDEPLFLAAFGLSDNFVLTYKQLLSILRNEYHKMPDYMNRKSVHDEDVEDLLKGLYGAQFWYHMPEMLKTFMISPKNNLNRLKNFCDDKFQHQIATRNLTTNFEVISGVSLREKSTIRADDFVNKGVINETKDDSFMRFFRPHKLSNPHVFTTKDDTALASHHIRSI